MPRITNQVLVELIAENKKFRESFNQAQKQTTKLKDSIGGPTGISGSFGSLGKAASRLLPIMATVGTAIAGAFAAKAVIAAANAQEEAVNSVATALARAGEDVKTALPELQKFATELQRNSIIGDEAALSMLALAQGYGASKDQAKQVVTAAAELSAATGKSLQEAVAQVSKTLGGFAGELGEVNPAIKGLTKEQLQAGDAARILIEQYGGTAKSKLNTFSGAVTQSSNAFGDLLEEIGFLITKNPAVIKLVQISTSIFETLGATVAANSTQISGFITKGVNVIIKILPDLLRGFQFLGEAFGVLLDLSPFDDIGSAVTGLKVVINTTFAVILNQIKTFITVATLQFRILDNVLGGRLGIADKIAGVEEKLGGLIARLGQSIGEDLGFVEPIESATEKSGDLIGGLIDKINGIGDSLAEVPDSKVIEVDFLPKAAPKQEVAAAAKKAKKVGADTPVVTDPNAIFGDQIAEAFKQSKMAKFIRDELPRDFAIGFTEGLASAFSKIPQAADSVLKGIQGGNAQGIIAGGAGVAAQAAGTAAFGPAGALLGPLAEQLTHILARGPDEVKKTIEAFADSFDSILSNIAEAIPVFIDTIVDKTPEITEAIAKNAPRIAIAIAATFANPAIQAQIAVGVVNGVRDGFAEFLVGFNNDLIDINNKLNKVTGAFEDAIGGGVKIWQKLTSNFLRSAIGEDLNALADNIASAFTEAFKPIEDFFRSLGGKFGGGKSGKDIISGIAGEIEKTTGIRVPRVATGGFVKGSGILDTVPALLTPGELVIDRETGPELRSFLKRQEDDSATLTAILNAVNKPQTVEASINIDGRELAKSILNLNRRNARLA